MGMVTGRAQAPLFHFCIWSGWCQLLTWYEVALTRVTPLAEEKSCVQTIYGWLHLSVAGFYLDALTLFSSPLLCLLTASSQTASVCTVVSSSLRPPGL